MREWFFTLAGSILIAGAIGFIPLAHYFVPYILYILGFFGIVFGIVIVPFPRKEVAQCLVACIIIASLLALGTHYGLF